MRSRSKILRPGPGHGKSRFPCAERLTRFMNTRAMKVITPWKVCSQVHALKRRHPVPDRRLTMQRKIFVTLTGIGLLAAALPLFAHHAFTAEFDAKKPLKLRGNVVKVELINPHSWIHIDVKNPDGTTTRWMIEGGTPNTLLRRGFTKNSLPAGTEILVDGYQAKDGSNRANGRDLTFPDGKKIFLGSSGPEGPPPDAVKP